MELGSNIKSQYEDFLKTKRGKTHKMQFTIVITIIFLIIWMTMDFIYFKQLFSDSISLVQLLQHQGWMQVFSSIY